MAGRPLVLDGGLSTELEHRGHDISGRLWSARLLLDAPDAITAAHRAFLDAGADIVTTASYQASPEGFARAGLAGRSEELIRLSVRLARRAVEESGREALVAGSVGPYGAMLADGSEYTGQYGDIGLAELRAFHRPRLEILAAAGVDVLAVETVPSILEVEALIAELDRLGHPAWLSLTTTTSGPASLGAGSSNALSSPATTCEARTSSATTSGYRVRTRRDEPAEQAFALARDIPSVVAVGVNCTHPAGVGEALRIAVAASGKPGIVYPNSGEGWDAQARAWTPMIRPASGAVRLSGAAGMGELEPPAEPFLGDVRGWRGEGARIIGGCCRVGPAQIAAVAQALQACTGTATPVRSQPGTRRPEVSHDDAVFRGRATDERDKQQRPVTKGRSPAPCDGRTGLQMVQMLRLS